jgi:hypothetical protein
LHCRFAFCSSNIIPGPEGLWTQPMLCRPADDQGMPRAVSVKGCFKSMLQCIVALVKKIGTQIDALARDKCLGLRPPEFS